MTEIKLYNTMARAKQVFTPIDPKNVRMYVCGPTVYDRAHLGNARPVVVFDVLYRLLRHVYGADHVTYVRNFTDVDDKINATALQRKEAGAKGTLEELVHERSNETIDWYLNDMRALGAMDPDQMPRATEFIQPMIDMIEDLIAKGHAYPDGAGHVLFSVKSYKDYGQLSGRSVDDMIAGARVEVADNKRDPMDFVLWKPSTDDLPGWDSPWGRGRPGWHIECSAMSHDLLGASFDIHGGGNDLQFPHHENEIAQSCCAHPEGQFARYWLHNEMLQVEGKKMSKSLGNFFTVHDLLEQGVPGEEIRMSFLLSHYRSKMDFGVARRAEARKILKRFAQVLGGNGLAFLESLTPSEPLEPFLAELSNDLDTVKAVKMIDTMTNPLPTNPAKREALIRQSYASQLILGFDLKDSPIARDRAVEHDRFSGVIHAALNDADIVTEIASRIDEAREKKDFATADELRDALTSAGVEVRVTKEGTSTTRLPNFDSSKLEGL